MHQYEQTILEAPKGNCFATCLACILELDPSTVPNFIGDFPSSWNNELHDWLQAMNLGFVYLQPQNPDFCPDGYAIASYTVDGSENLHCVVCYDGDVVWDPSQVARRILRPSAWTVLTILDPARPVNKEVYSRQS